MLGDRPRDKGPGSNRGPSRFRGRSDRYVSQQRKHTEDDHDDTHDLLGAAVKRQQVDQIKDEDDDKDKEKDKEKNKRDRTTEQS